MAYVFMGSGGCARVEYEISELGRSLAPLFAHLAEWATTNLEHVERARRHHDAAGVPRG